MFKFGACFRYQSGGNFFARSGRNFPKSISSGFHKTINILVVITMILPNFIVGVDLAHAFSPKERIGEETAEANPVYQNTMPKINYQPPEFSHRFLVLVNIN
jgi:hypothetical protein